MTAMDSVETTVTIDPRFRGPDESGNGGYVCGLVAQFVDGPATVTLRRPPPLARALSVLSDGTDVQLLDGETLVAEARRSDVPIEPPPPVSLDTASRVAADPSELTDHPFRRCYVCGPDRADGLRIFPGELGDGLIAGPWTPGEDLTDREGLVSSRFLWAALDCPSGWAAATLAARGRVAMLGRLTSVVHYRPAPGDPCLVVASADGQDGRKLSARSALYTASGRLLAAAVATWITVE